MVLMFLSSVEEHIFLPKTNQKNFSGCYPQTPMVWGDTHSRNLLCIRPCFLTPNTFDALPPLYVCVS